MTIQLPSSKIPFLSFEPLADFNAWKAAYGQDIRVDLEYNILKNSKVGLMLADDNTAIHVPRYKKGDWRYGIPERVPLGKELKLLRLPAARYKDKYLLLDGYHRMTELLPKLVLLDYIIIEEKVRKYVTDLCSDWWD